jgi:response regulator RpfG family c-di-GMP phosphodiesterase
MGHREKAKRITSINDYNAEDFVLDPLETEDELERRLPEIWNIEDDEIRNRTVDVFIRACPAYFWELPTSSSGNHHPKDERGRFGNWLHTKRVFMMYSNLAESDRELGALSEHDIDCGKSAALIHDMLKYGWPSDNHPHTVDDHPIIAAEVAREMGGLPDHVYNLIYTHMGPWNSPKVPKGTNERLLHRADKAVSPDWATIGVYRPSKELTEELGVVGYNSDGEEL